jgi:DNA-binding FrmR family transcriptional regulator
MNEKIYFHDHGDGVVHCHTHGEGGHVHSPETTKAVVNRLARAIGHLESVKKMVEDGRDCSEVLVQLAAVRSAINNTGKVILKEHLSSCIVEAIKSGDTEELDELNRAVERFL